MPRSAQLESQPCFYTQRRPLVGIALGIVSGMVLAASSLFSPRVLLFAALCTILLAGWLIRSKVSILLVFCSVALVSACRFMVAAEPLSAVEIDRLLPQLPLENVQLLGDVLTPPEYRAYRSGELGTWVFTLKCKGLRCGGAALGRDGSPNRPQEAGRDGSPSRPQACSVCPPLQGQACMRLARRSSPTCSPTTINPTTIHSACPDSSGAEWIKRRGRIQVRVTGVPPVQLFRQGQRIGVSGTLRERIYPGGEPIELEVQASEGCRLLSGPSRFSPFIRGQQLREAAARTLSNGIKDHTDQLAVYRALLLGYRKAVPSRIHQYFKRTGTLHIFAISGLHVGIVGLLITVVLKSLGLSRDRWGLLLLPLLLGYVVATGMKSSALRALTMAAVYFLAPLFRRKPDIPVSIAFALILLLFFKPLEIFSAGFIFSFTVVSFIVMFFARIPNTFIFRGAGWMGAIRAYMVSLGITSLAAFIASIPLTALFFGSFSPVSLVGNLVVVPLTFCIVLSGWLAILMPFASEIFNGAALVFINGLLGTVHTLAELPVANLQVAPPPLTALLFWYGGWIYLLVHARSPRQRTAAGTLIVMAVLLTLLILC